MIASVSFCKRDIDNEYTEEGELRRKEVTIPEAGLGMHRAPISSEGLVAWYPQILPQTPELVENGAMFRQQRRMERSAH